jgi:hypothetical protein
MTEAQWLACRDPDALLEFLRQRAYGRHGNHPDARRLRLFACACCRRAWPALADERSRRAVEVAERYADRRATRQELARAFIAARGIGQAGHAAFAAATACAPRGNAGRVAAQAALAGNPRHWAAERTAQADLLRDIFGNPFVPAIVVEAEWLSGRDRAISELARAAYDEHTFDGLPLLADALENAGCTSAGLLTHLRSPGPHARGCWALDLVSPRSVRLRLVKSTAAI